MSSKIKTALIGVVLVFVILIVVSLLTAAPSVDNVNSPKPGAPQAGNNSSAPTPNLTNTAPPAVPTFQTKELRLVVIVAKQDGTYRVRDVDANTESDLFIPSDANITAGSRDAIKEGTELTVQKFMAAANGIVATQLSVTTAQ